MRKLFLFTLCLMVALALTSCDSNKSKVEKLTKQFIAAVNGNDKATIYDIYNVAKNLKNAQIPNKIINGDVLVERDSTGNYVATIDNPRQQKLVFKFDGGDHMNIVNSYSILTFDSTAIELGIKTGVPVKKLDDLAISKLLDENGDYINYLTEKYPEALRGKLVTEEGSYGSSNYSVFFNQTIRNSGTMPIKGDDYSLEFYVYTLNDNGAPKTDVEPGVDLAPGEAFTYTVDLGMSWYSARMFEDIHWKTKFLYKNKSVLQSLLIYPKLGSDAYDDFLKEQAKETTTPEKKTTSKKKAKAK